MNQSSKIQNPETQVPKTPQMNDRDFLNDLLTTEKYMTSAYSIALNESSNQLLYSDIAGVCKETQDCQRELYNLMFRKGFYSLEQADEQKLQQGYQQFQGYSTQFPYQQ
ncbi:spore coat protein [Bacillus solitudinis]|uniref:spore coat protein n=1 Tax=Bacillus solitudinis TaxID=2014074 RepID=UPI000C23905F|nr:spore coat protein [Bacillus solitudinis]